MSDTVFLHRDIDPLVFEHLDYVSKRALRLVSKAVKRAVDNTVRKVEIIFDFDYSQEDEEEEEQNPSLSVDATRALLNADWDLEELVLHYYDNNVDDVPRGMLYRGIKRWTNLKKLSMQEDLPENPKYYEYILLSEICLNAMLSQRFLGSNALELLDLSDVLLKDKHIKKLATLRWASNLKTLKLRHQGKRSPASLQHIAKVSSALTSLDLSENYGLASRGVAPLAALTNLKELDLSATGWTGQGFAELAISLTNLTSLDAGNNNFSGIHTHVSELSMPSLKKLFVWACGLTPAFFSIKLDLPSVEALSLGGVYLSVDGLWEVFKRQRLPSLKWLDLGGCVLNGDWLTEFVAAGHVMCPLLEQLYLNWNKQLGISGMRALCNSPWKLKYLNLSECKLGSEEMKALAEGNFQWLHHLDLSHNDTLRAEDLIALASTANMKNIESINLVGTMYQNYREVEQEMVKNSAICPESLFPKQLLFQNFLLM